MKKFIKALVIVVLVVIAILLVLPGNIKVEREKIINASPQTVFNQVNVLQNWPQWSPWFKKDPDTKLSYQGPGGEGSSYSWESEHSEVGSGNLEIIESIENTSIKTRIDFGDQGAGNGYWIFEKEDNATKVTWGFTSEGKWYQLGNKIFSLFADKVLGGMLDEGLSSLKQITEVMAEKATIEVEDIVIAEPIRLLSIRKTITKEDLKTSHQKAMEELQALLTSTGVQAKGAPLTIYHKWGQEIEMEVGFPIDNNAPVKQQNTGTIAAGKALKVIHYGSYESLGATYAFINDYIEENGIPVFGAPWEVYVVSPAQEEDPTKWKTEIYFPI